MNIANKVTVFRIIVCIIYFIIISLLNYNAIDNIFFYHSFFLFCAAAISDVIDGYLARKYDIETAFGRIVDPIADKILILGSFVLFLGFENIRSICPPWVVVIIIFREFMVTGLRGYSESINIPFPAMKAGKLKMLIQTCTVGYILFYLTLINNFELSQLHINIAGNLLLIFVILTILNVIYSGISYLVTFLKLIKGKNNNL